MHHYSIRLLSIAAAVAFPAAVGLPSASAFPAATAAFNDIHSLADRLDSTERFNASARYSVLLPSAADDIVYTIDLQSEREANDTLSPCDYYIDWRVDTPTGHSEGFSSYANGSHYRYRDERLQEYHTDWDPAPFTSGGGVQRHAQFVELMPQYLAATLREIATDTTYSYTFTPSKSVNGRYAAVVEATRMHNGYTGSIATYTFDATTGMPIAIDIEYNPGAISEQTVSVSYGAPSKQPAPNFNEETLIALHPEVFERFRQSSFRAENLPGTSLPGFSLPTLSGERFAHDRDERFHTPVVVVFIDPSTATAETTVDNVRSTLATLPFNVGVIWAFPTSDIDAAEELTGQPRPDEIVLLSSKSLARDCGITSYPTLLFVNRDGRIDGVQLGFNKSLPEIVMEKTALLH